MIAKAELRRTAEARRRALAAPGHAERLAGWSDHLEVEPDAVVSGYCAFRDEADPRLLMLALAQKGHGLALPAIVGRSAPLRFHRWRESDALVTHSYGVSEPSADSPIVVPAVLLVPLLAFDRHGTRLGYGGGYYDRTLAVLRAAGTVTAIGIAYAGQEVDALPRSEYDQPLDAILTEDGLRRFGS